MAEKFPQADLPRGLRGGADAWDDGPAGALLRADYFTAAPASATVTGSTLTASASLLAGSATNATGAVITPRAYTIASGADLYAGRTFTVPWSLPAAGSFKNISLNTLNDIKPAGYGGESAGPFANWAGGARLRDFGTHGGYAAHGSGHLSGAEPLWQGVFVFDPVTQLWVHRNKASTIHVEADATNAYGEYPDGSVYPPHTYDCLAELPASLGGGTSGTLLRFFHPGASFASPRCVHAYDVSAATGGVSRVIDNIPMDGGYSTYGMTALDETRGGYWVMTYVGWGPLTFVDPTDWSLTTYSATFNEYGNYSLVHVPTRDCLVSLGTDNSNTSQIAVYVLPLNDIAGGWTKVTLSGTGPTNTQAGGVWSTLLGCIVSYSAGGSYTVHKLALPANLRTGTWTWTPETLTGEGGATPAQCVGASNGAWGRMIEFPSLGCFLWADSVSGPVQAWRLTGM